MLKIPYVQNTFVISLKERVDRRKLFEDYAKQIGLPFEFFDAYWGRDLPIEFRERQQGPMPSGNESVLSTDIHAKGGMLGCTYSHYMLAKQILERYTSGYIMVFEDDSLIPYKYIDYLKDSLLNIPEDTGMLYLGGIHRLGSGYFPIKTPYTNIIEISSSYSTIGFIYNVNFLKELIVLYEQNLAATKEQEGILIIDKLLCRLHAKMTLNIDDPNNYLKDNLENLTQKLANKYRIYGLNPYIVGNYTPEDGNISYSDVAVKQMDYTNLLRVGKTTKTLTKEQIMVLVERIKLLKKQHPEVLPRIYMQIDDWAINQSNTGDIFEIINSEKKI